LSEALPKRPQIFFPEGWQRGRNPVAWLRSVAGNAPYLPLPGGKKIVLTIDHIEQVQSAAGKSTLSSNLQFSFWRENTWVLKRLVELKGLQRRTSFPCRRSSRTFPRSRHSFDCRRNQDAKRARGEAGGGRARVQEVPPRRQKFAQAAGPGADPGGHSADENWRLRSAGAGAGTDAS
jgi:hypothetical protein